MDERRLQLELERERHKTLLLQSRLERMQRSDWTERSNRIAREVIEVLGQLELEADPMVSSSSEGPMSKAPRFDYPIPGAGTAPQRRTLESFQRRLERAVKDQRDRWDAELR